jgi:glycine cleavage system H protein
MSDIPEDLRFTRSHEWLRTLPDGTVEIGISDHAQRSLGDLVFVELPDIGRNLSVGEACAVVESVKAASDVYTPIAGAVVAINSQLQQTPELINREPYAGGWLFRLRPTSSVQAVGLLSASEYQVLEAQG